MLKFTLTRAGTAVLVAFTLSIVTFVLLHTATDPAAALAGPDADPQTVAQIRAQLGLDRPLVVQYWDWLSGVLQGDLGESWFWKQPVINLIRDHAPITLRLALSATLVTILIALPLGIAAAMWPNSLVDRAALALGVAAQAMPSFWLGLMGIILLAVIVPIFPVSGDTTWLHFVLPALVLGTTSVPAVMRLTRSGLIDVMATDYVRTARAKGFTTDRVLWRHALRNALLPVVSVLAIQLGNKLGGSVVTESVFALNGLGRLALQAILSADIPMLQILVFVFALTFVLLTFLADLLNAWLDPRIRLG
jgi:peptide/nickel transport system permease protein